MATEYNGGVQVISQPTFVRSIDVTSADFDGTDTANISDSLKTKETNNSRFNPWKKNGGFIVLPSAAGTVRGLLWEDYERSGKVVDDTLAQDVVVSGATWHESRFVKIYSASSVKTMQIGTVL